MVRDFAHYAKAAYGTSYLWRGAGGGRRVKHLLCCGCCHRGSGSIEGDGCLCSNAAAIRAYLPHLEDDDIIHISFINRELTQLRKKFYPALPSSYHIIQDSKSMLAECRTLLCTEIHFKHFDN